MTRVILHVDMDAFYASIEARENPAIAGRPIIVGALPNQRGVVAACNYEARKYGIHSAMNIKDAYRLCPQGVFLKTRIDLYAEVSQKIREIWLNYSESVEFLAFDEAYIDISGQEMTFVKAKSIAKEIKERIYSSENLTCSVGVGYSMASAKLASEEKKPDGLFVIPDKEAWLDLVLDRKVSVLHGVGKVTSQKLKAIGIVTVRQLLSAESLFLQQYGKSAKQILAIAKGEDPRTVTPYYENSAKSIGQERTLQKDSTDSVFLKSLLRLYARELSHKLHAEELFCQTISLKLTYGNMQSITRSKTVDATRSAESIYEIAAALFDSLESRPVRLIGITVSNFCQRAYEQLSFFDLGAEKKVQRKKHEILEKTLHSLEKRFGKNLIRSASELEAAQIIEKKKSGK